MTQDEFREAMNRSKREGGLLYITNGTISAIALGYDSGTDEAVLFKGGGGFRLLNAGWTIRPCGNGCWRLLRSKTLRLSCLYRAGGGGQRRGLLTGATLFSGNYILDVETSLA